MSRNRRRIDDDKDPVALFEQLAERYEGQDDEFAELCAGLADQFRPDS